MCSGMEENEIRNATQRLACAVSVGCLPIVPDGASKATWMDGWAKGATGKAVMRLTS